MPTHAWALRCERILLNQEPKIEIDLGDVNQLLIDALDQQKD